MTALGEYVAETDSAPAPARRKAPSSSNRLGPQIASSNVGYQLLRKAGWQEGQGIGINQQGRPIPLSAYHQQARHGIGADTKPAKALRSDQNKLGRKRQPGASSDNGGTVMQKELLPVPDVPEDPKIKRQRHQQVSKPSVFSTFRCPTPEHLWLSYPVAGLWCCMHDVLAFLCQMYRFF